MKFILIIYLYSYYYHEQILQDIEKHDIRIYPSAYAEDRETLPDIEVIFF